MFQQDIHEADYCRLGEALLVEIGRLQPRFTSPRYHCTPNNLFPKLLDVFAVVMEFVNS